MLPQKSKPAGRLIPERKSNFRVAVALSVTAAFVVIGTLGASAGNELMRGHATMNERAPSDPKAKSPEPTTHAKAYSNLTNEYGAVASSPTVAAAIRKATAGASDKNVDRASGAKAAADREEALAHGYMLPGTDPTSALMHDLVPPGMSQEQAAILSRNLPRLPRMPETMTPEMVARMAHEPGDPMAGLPQGMSREGVEAASQQMLEGYMRGRYGPVYTPPLHRDHNGLAQPNQRTAKGFIADHQVSLIAPEYSFDSGSIREMTDSSGNVVSQYGYDPYGRQTITGAGPVADFGNDGYYVHQRSGLNLATFRAYSPALGRWLSRDPLEEQGGGTNLYQYAANNPISLKDPLGLYVIGGYNINTGNLNLYNSDTGLQINVGGGFSGGWPITNLPDTGWIPLGPIPPGVYGIGPQEPMLLHPKVPFYPLTPISHCGVPWRKGCGIHPGKVSYGCITFPGTGSALSGYNSPGFNSVSGFINSGGTPINVGGVNYPGIIYVF